MSLYNLSQDPKWSGMAEHAKRFVCAMYTSSPAPGHYFTGTGGDGVTINPNPLPADCQSWAALAGLCSPGQATNALAWLWQNLRVTCTVGTNTSEGIKFSDRGSGISTEQTAGAAMALRQNGFFSEAAELLRNLQTIQDAAASCQTNGIVAAPCAGCTATGFGNCLPNKPHVASSAWSGLAPLVASGDPMANPLMPVPGIPLHVSREGATLHFWWPGLSFKNYSVLVSTNVAMSLTNWTVIPVGQTNRWSELVQSGDRFYCLKVH